VIGDGAAVSSPAGVRLLSEPTESLSHTPLYDAHVAAGGRMVPFAGYSLPVQYRDGVMKEHLWTREHAGAFDVSHMGPSFLTLTELTGDGEADHAAIAAIAETLVCGDIKGLKPGQLRYTLLLNKDGGLIDDLMIGRPAAPDRQGMLYIVVNAATKDGDFALFEAAANGKAKLTRADDRALIALQGPEAVAVLTGLIPEAAELSFMNFRRVDYAGDQVVIARSGYTGEDGFEILIKAAYAQVFWMKLLEDERVRPIGLGARDSLRLEAGLPLYGHDADETVSPIEAGLNFAVAKKRREAGDLRGAARIAAELAGDLNRVRVGLRILEGAPAREGADIADLAGQVVGRVTSGGFSPTLSQPIAMGFVPPAFRSPGVRLNVIVRGKAQGAEVVPMPFVPHRYVRKS
jgi:aminomethyltransferase